MDNIDWNGITQFVTAIGILISVLVSAYNNIRLKEVSRKVDGAATAQTTKIEVLTNQVSDLKVNLAESKQTAAVLAQSKTRSPVGERSSDTAKAIQDSKNLEKIQVNTKDVAKSIKDLKEE